MRTSLNEIRKIEAYLLHNLSTSDRLVFEARMLLDKSLRKNVALQKKTYRLIEHHRRMLLKQEFQKLHTRLFQDQANAALKKEIVSFFKS